MNASGGIGSRSMPGSHPEASWCGRRKDLTGTDEGRLSLKMMSRPPSGRRVQGGSGREEEEERAAPRSRLGPPRAPEGKREPTRGVRRAGPRSRRPQTGRPLASPPEPLGSVPTARPHRFAALNCLLPPRLHDKPHPRRSSQRSPPAPSGRVTRRWSLRCLGEERLRTGTSRRWGSLPSIHPSGVLANVDGTPALHCLFRAWFSPLSLTSVEVPIERGQITHRRRARWHPLEMSAERDRSRLSSHTEQEQTCKYLGIWEHYPPFQCRVHCNANDAPPGRLSISLPEGIGASHIAIATLSWTP